MDQGDPAPEPGLSVARFGDLSPDIAGGEGAFAFTSGLVVGCDRWMCTQQVPAVTAR